MKLLINALVKYITGLVAVGALLFLPAGTFDYLGAWIFIALLFVPMLILGAVLFVKSPELLKKRLDAKEKRSTEKGVVGLSALVFVGGFVVAGLDCRFSLSHVPMAVCIIASCLFIVAYILYAEVMRENAYLSRTIEVQEGQKVVDSGLYSVVRHPMYSATVLLFLMIPLILGSLWALLVFLVYPLLIAVRIKDEEKLLTSELEGYSEYKKKVKWKLIPLIW